MKKIIKTTLKWSLVLLGLIVSGIIILLIIGPPDAVVLSEQEIRDNQIRDSVTFSTSTIKDFRAQSLDGKTLDSGILKSHRLTVLNIWGTFCGPCISEMPELEKLYKSLPPEVLFVSLCVDAIDEKHQNIAREQLKSQGASYLTLIPDTVLKKQIADKTRAFPTTLFFNSEGKTVGGTYSGAPTAEAYRKAIGLKLATINAPTQ